MVKSSSSVIAGMPLSTERLLSMVGLGCVAAGEASCLFLVGMTMVRSSSFAELGSSAMEPLLSLFAWWDLLVGLGDGAESFGDCVEAFGEGIADLGEGICLTGVAAGLSRSSFFLVAEAAADRARLVPVSWRGLFTGLF